MCHECSEKAKHFRKDGALRQVKSRKNQNCFKLFHNSKKYGPIFICVCCHQKHFETNVKVLPDDFEDALEIKFPGLYHKSIHDEDNYLETIKVDKDGLNSAYNYICHTCKRHLNKGVVPPMSYKNGLELYDIDKHGNDLKLKEVEVCLVAQNAIFQKIYLLPRSRWSAIKDKIVNVPIPLETVEQTAKSLPKTPKEARLIPVKFKRKLSYKNTHKEEFVNPDKIVQALKIFRTLGHKYYTDISIDENYNERCQNEDPEGHSVFVDQTVLSNSESDQGEDDSDKESVVDAEQQEEIKKRTEEEEIAELTAKENQEDEEYYRKNDPIRKFQFDYNNTLCLTESNPGAFVNIENTTEPETIKTTEAGNDSENNTTAPSDSDENSEVTKKSKDNADMSLSFAPGEGQIPTNILKETDWDIKTWPHLFPDGNYGLYHERERKLTNLQYFQQRILNHDLRFANNPSYVYGAVQYVEKQQLERNVNISFLRGKSSKYSD